MESHSVSAGYQKSLFSIYQWTGQRFVRKLLFPRSLAGLFLKIFWKHNIQIIVCHIKYYGLTYPHQYASRSSNFAYTIHRHWNIDLRKIYWLTTSKLRKSERLRRAIFYYYANKGDCTQKHLNRKVFSINAYFLLLQLTCARQMIVLEIFLSNDIYVS